jgi:hypothetical protein
VAVDSGLRSGSGWVAVCGMDGVCHGEHFEWSERVNRSCIERDMNF